MNKNKTSRISTVILVTLSVIVLTYLITAFRLTDHIKDHPDVCHCHDTKQDDELNMLQAMPFSLLPALDVAHSAELPICGGEVLLCSELNVSPDRCI